MSKTASSKRWLKEHFSDEYVHRAQQEGYRSRAVYKLIELDKNSQLIKPGMKVIDIGAAPGSWSQYVAQKIGDKGSLIANDILPMNEIENSIFIEGDFSSDEVLQKILHSLNNQLADLVICDIAPNMSGTSADQLRAIYLNELALDLAVNTLKDGGGFVCKVFHGVGFEEFLKTTRQHFATLKVRKPKASRARSKEVYIVGQAYKKLS